eukprot:1310550-Karenia_brevis.AAC.1
MRKGGMSLDMISFNTILTSSTRTEHIDASFRCLHLLQTAVNDGKFHITEAQPVYHTILEACRASEDRRALE